MTKSSKEIYKKGDAFSKLAKSRGFRSRSALKLLEVQKKDNFIKPTSRILDLGSSPGGWSQVLTKKIGLKGKVVGIDLLEVAPIKGIDFIQGDFMQEEILNEMVDKLENKPVDLVISDMAPNISGIKMVDQQKAIYLNELAFDFASKHLKQNGCFLVKSFVGKDFEEFVKDLRSCFKKVYKIKPDSSRSRSAEIFLLGYEFCSS